MGGSCDYIWSMETDQVLQKYGYESFVQVETVELPNTPPLSVTLPKLRSRSNSLASSFEDDVFFDANDTLPPSIPPPNAITKLISPSPLPGTVPHSFFYGNLSSWDASFLHFVSTKQQRPVLSHQDTSASSSSSSNIIVEAHLPAAVITTPTQSNNVMQRVLATGQQLEFLFKRLTRHLVRISFGPNRGVFYWILLYVFLRGPVEMLVKRSLRRVGTNRLTTTTIGITAAIAAAMSAGLSSALERFKK
jgi:hypothetical protein